eukprot:5818227-Pyramimonas_sp.AAC.1
MGDPGMCAYLFVCPWAPLMLKLICVVGSKRGRMREETGGRPSRAVWMRGALARRWAAADPRGSGAVHWGCALAPVQVQRALGPRFARSA